MDIFQVYSLAASIVSIILAVFAVILAIVFYKMSSDLAQRTKESSDRIGSNVDRLEMVFDRLYSDTFGIMKDTVQDMRKQLWPDTSTSDSTIKDEIEKKTEEKITGIKKEIIGELSSLVQESRQITDGKLTDVNSRLTDILERTIAESRKAETEAREETIRETILNLIKSYQRQGKTITAGIIITDSTNGVVRSGFLRELFNMNEHGLITWSGNPDRLRLSDNIKLVDTND